MNKLILLFLGALAVFFIYRAATQPEAVGVSLLCLAGLFPLFMVFRNRVRDEQKMDKLIDAVKKK